MEGENWSNNLIQDLVSMRAQFARSLKLPIRKKGSDALYPFSFSVLGTTLPILDTYIGICSKGVSYIYENGLFSQQA